MTVCRARHLSRETQALYGHWVRRYLEFHHGDRMRAADPAGVVVFLNQLAERQHMSASSHLQALHALLFLFRHVLAIEVGMLQGLRRMRRPQRLPEVLSVEEVRATLNAMHGLPRLMAALLYGSGMRVGEVVALRVKDVDLRGGVLTVRAGLVIALGKLCHGGNADAVPGGARFGQHDVEAGRGGIDHERLDGAAQQPPRCRNDSSGQDRRKNAAQAHERADCPVQ